MRRIGFLIFTALCLSPASPAQDTLSVDSVQNYNGMGWKAIVMKNNLITVATMPAIGARVMQYDLGGHPSIFVDPTQYGKTSTPRNGGQVNYGGFKNWPSPQNAWPGSWPPPPTLDYGAYTCEIMTNTADSISVHSASPTEQWIAPGIRFERTATVFTGTSRVRMEQSIINDGSAAAHWGMWDITQSIVRHAGQSDYTNFWGYFPLNPNSTMGSDGVTPERSSPAWVGEVAPGIYGVQFVASGTKIFADPAKGWIAYTDRKDSVVYIKTFDVFEGSTYPDAGARVTIYVSSGGSNPYMEIEVKGPVYDLAAAGGKETFTENWYAAKMRAPVVDVFPMAAVAQSLSYNSTTHVLSGIYGVFYTGNVRLTFVGAGGTVVGESEDIPVTPMSEFQFSREVTIPPTALLVELRLVNSKGDVAGLVDGAEVTKLISGISSEQKGSPEIFTLAQNYPNPFNPSTTIGYSLPGRSSVVLSVYDMLGNEIWTTSPGVQNQGYHQIAWNGTSSTGMPVAGGVYLYRMKVTSADGKMFERSAKMVLVK